VGKSFFSKPIRRLKPIERPAEEASPSPSRVYCIFVQLSNSNVLGKLPIRDSNYWVNWKLLLVDWAKIQYTRDGERPYL
jgi:hypothetical protein